MTATGMVPKDLKALLEAGTASPREFAAYLGVSKATANLMLRQGAITYIQVRGRRRIPWRAIYEFCARQLVEPAGAAV